MTIHNVNKKKYKTLTHNVVWLRKHHGLSKRKMAVLLGISPASLNNLENGEIPPRLGVDILYAIHDNFDIPPSTLISKWFED